VPGYSFLAEFCAGNLFLLPYTLDASQCKQWHSAVNFGRALHGIEIAICPQLQAPPTISVEFILNEAKINDLLDSVLTTRDSGEEGKLIFSTTLLLWKNNSASLQGHGKTRISSIECEGLIR
jgi:hypothetical protein